MDCKELSFARLWLRESRPESVISLQLSAGQQHHFTKINYSLKLRVIDFKELSFARLWLREFRPESVISPHL